MSFLDTLPEAQQDTYRAAVIAATEDYATFCRDRDELAAAEGTRAVAEAAWYDGHPLGSVDAIEARYRSLQARARKADAA